MQDVAGNNLPSAPFVLTAWLQTPQVSACALLVLPACVLVLRAMSKFSIPAHVQSEHQLSSLSIAFLSRSASSNMLCKATPAAHYLFQGKPCSEPLGAVVLPWCVLLPTVCSESGYEKDRRWPLCVNYCADGSLSFLQSPSGGAPKLPHIQEGFADTERKVAGPRQSWDGDAGNLTTTPALSIPFSPSLYWLLYRGHGKGRMLDLCDGQVTSSIKSELKTEPLFGRNTGANMFRGNPQDVCCSNSSQGPMARLT